MRLTFTLVSARSLGSFATALFLCTTAVAGMGCAKDGSAPQESPAVKAEGRSSPENTAGVAPIGAQPSPSTAAAAGPSGTPSDVGKAPAATATDSTKSAEAVAKADIGRVGSATKSGEPAAPPAAAPTATAELAAAAPPAATEPAAATPPAAPPAENATPTVVSPKVGESNFSVWMQAGKVKAGQQGVVQVVLVPKNGFHCNENYPYKMKMSDPPAGVSFPSPLVRKEGMSVSASRGVMSVPFVASTAGDVRLSGKFSFSVCTTDQCLIDSRELAITVKVEE